MGHGIAEVLARTKTHVWLQDTSPDALAAAEAGIRTSVARLQRHHLISDEAAGVIPGRIHPTTDLERAAAHAVFVIEAIPEKLAAKQELLGQLDRLAPADAVLATNSSSFRIAEVTARVSAERRSHLVGSHFFCRRRSSR